MNTQQPQFEASQESGRTSQPGVRGQGRFQSGVQGQGQTSKQGGQQIGMALQDVESPQQREGLYAILEAVKTCEWCADQCIQHADPSMVECIRLCEDVSELGETVMTLLPKRSRYAQPLLSTFVQAAQACAQECSQHSHSHCQECSQVLGKTVTDAQQLLSTFGQQSVQAGQQGVPVGRLGSQVGQQGIQGTQQAVHGGQQGGAQFGFQ